MSLKNRALKYFDAFSNKDFDALELMFFAGSMLRDWEVKAHGKIEVFAAFKKIFDSVDTITVVPIMMYEDGNVVIAELKIIIDNKETILVTDVILFDESGRIVSIKAYKG